MTRRTHEYLPGVGKLLKASRDVYAGADARLLAFGLGARELHDRLAGLDADPHRQRNRHSLVGLGPSNAGLRRPEGPVRVVRPGNRHSEQRKNRVANEGPNAAAFALDHLSKPAEGLIERALEPFPGPNCTISAVEPTTSTKRAVTTRRSIGPPTLSCARILGFGAAMLLPSHT